MNSVSLTSAASNDVSMLYMTPDKIRAYFKSETDRQATGHLCVSGEKRECLVLTDIDASLLRSLPKGGANLTKAIAGIRQVFDNILSELGLRIQSIEAKSFRCVAYGDLNFLIITPDSPSYFCLTVDKPLPRTIDLKMRLLDLPTALRKTETKKYCIEPNQKLTFEAHRSVINTLHGKLSLKSFTNIFGMLGIQVQCWFHATRKANWQPKPLSIYVCTKSNTFSLQSPLGILFSLHEKQEKQEKPKELIDNTRFGLSTITEEESEHEPEC